MIFYNGFNLLVDVVAIMATAFITYRIAFRAGFWEGMTSEAKANPYVSLDKHWEGVIK